MRYEKTLINITNTLVASDRMYSLICLDADKLSITLTGVRCFLDGHYLLCLNIDDTLDIHDGSYTVLNLQFRPYFYNVNLNHRVLGMELYNEMREKYGYPDFHLFRTRNERFNGVLSLNDEEYEMIKIHFLNCIRLIDGHKTDGLWSCRTRSEMISILRIAEGANLGENSNKGYEILRYIRDNIGEKLTLELLCKRFSTNRTTLANMTKELTGMAPMQYVLEERLNQSRPDLLFTYISIADIAEKYGFGDMNYYIRAFKKRFGTTPHQYRSNGQSKRMAEERIYHIKAKTYSDLIMDMEARGYRFEPGLTRSEIAKIEEIYCITFPESLKEFYMTALPVSEDGFFPRWRDFSPENIEKIKGIMHPYEPEHLPKKTIIEYPPLIPIWGHRYLPICELDDPPVISCVEFDIIWYAKNLRDCLQKDFLTDPLDFRRNQPKDVPYIPLWSEAVEYNMNSYTPMVFVTLSIPAEYTEEFKSVKGAGVYCRGIEGFIFMTAVNEKFDGLLDDFVKEIKANAELLDTINRQGGKMTLYISQTEGVKFNFSAEMITLLGKFNIGLEIE